ncbi:unnamed protein product [Protopolystoma xenopodis]|uniref:RPGRIP1 C-terminal domain-containing protein n=1 Tax=Protopolystoma xenopodis TaxID=117903 RepID=A0A448XA57_9PLAT|nr:unnamed protein product [Protopolystoma xenopodis]
MARSKVLSSSGTGQEGSPQPSQLYPADRIQVGLHYVDLVPGCRLAEDPCVRQLYMEYSILGLPDVLETPAGLVMPNAVPGKAKRIELNYSQSETVREYLLIP